MQPVHQYAACCIVQCNSADREKTALSLISGNWSDAVLESTPLSILQPGAVCLQARAQFEAGSLYEGHAQAAALAWLGKWEAEVGGDPAAARDFFQASLAIDAEQREAGELPPMT